MPEFVRRDPTDLKAWVRLLVACGLAVQVAARAEGSCGGVVSQATPVTVLARWNSPPRCNKAA
jgi:hypothetical protein